MKINIEDYKWLTTVPASDINFKTRLKETDLATIMAALRFSDITKTARKALEIQVRKLSK